jgi:hypothetical protein
LEILERLCEKVGSSIKQCTCLQGTICEGFLATKQMSVGTPYLFTGSSPPDISVSEGKGIIVRKAF